MKIKFKHLLFALCLAQSGVSYAQSELLYTNLFSQSPVSKSFGFQGLYPVNLYRGLPDISIPIFEKKVSNTNFNISLNYDVSTVKPEAVHSWVGLGWSTNIGGAITRVVNGQYDELYTSHLNEHDKLSYLDHYNTLDKPDWDSQASLSAFYYDAENSLRFTSFYNYSMQSGNTNTLNFGGGLDNYTDKWMLIPDPDEFILNVLGINGRFYMNEKGKWIGRTRDGKTFSIQHVYKENHTIKPNSYISYNLRRILYGFTVTMDDGTQYIFGQDDNAVEFTEERPPCANCNFNEQIVASSWLINEVKFPDGKKIKYTYERAPKPNYIASQVGYDIVLKAPNIDLFESYGSTALNWQYNTYLKKVESDEFSVEINTSQVKPLNYQVLNEQLRGQMGSYLGSGDSSLLFNTWFKIDSITVRDKDNHTVNTTTFHYNNVDTTKRMHLEAVIKNNDEKYSFDYNPKTLPLYLDSKYDKWGYYAPSTHSTPDLEYTKAETLEWINHPTGGVTHFIYELNDFSKYGNKNPFYTSANTLELIDTVSPNEIAGGLRIKRIEACSEHSTGCVIKNYSYNGDNGKSSGILPYQFNFTRAGEVQDMYKFSHKSMGSYQSLKGENNMIGYSKVTVTDTNNGKTENYFTNFDTPSCNDQRGPIIMGPPDQFTGLYKSVPFTSFSLMRGKPLKEITSSASGVVQTKEYEYGYNNDLIKAYGLVEENIHYMLNLLTVTAYNVNFNSSFLKGIKTTLNGVETKESYDYEYNYNTLKSQKIIDSNGDEFQTNFTYAFDKPNNFLLGKYMVGLPLKSEEMKNGKVVSKTETLYPLSQTEADNKTSGLPLPTAQVSYQLQSNSPVTEATYDKFDSKGNLLQYTTKNGVSTSIIWGYKNNTLPIVKIQGAKLSDIPQAYVDQIINASKIDAQQSTDASEKDFVNALDQFKNRPELAGYLITTYSYDPLIGVKSIGQPSGIREFYKYNAANELERIMDQSGNIIKEFAYKYNIKKFYNSERSQTYTKNNCNSLQVGGTYTYIVPANKYVSLISSTDAEQQAANDLAANGQNAANTNAQCYNAQCYASSINGFQVGPHAEISQSVLGHFKVDIQVKVPNSLTNPDGSQWWQKGVANIPNPCRPNTNLAPDIFNNNVKELTTNTWWKVQITSAGDLIFIPNGYVAPGTQLYFVFEYDKTPN
ncbi:DUF5977 domain-containing protein [Chryseobacterium sp. AG844]|uniref:DUF5977 domain-containing protein n=1 Tax=Chryseobacterium sp. AG844 TaxID=2183998 RepID=UPI000D70AC8B|nr:DUF5977 domain-containing protein [Chryseobacterium sp. AG844]PWW30651.1 hypothetical protein DEU40_10166 [Chryseobacterium sp. AG844]